MIPTSPSPKVFTALLSGDVKQLATCNQHELRPFLPSLVRMVLSSPCSPFRVAMATQWEGKRKVIHTLISGMVEGNAIRKYLALDFVELKQDAKREQQLLKKLGPGETRPHSQSILASSLQYGLAIEFERSDHLRRFRLFLSEIFRVMAHLDGSGPFKMIQSDLFECEVHFDEMGDILCIAAAELPDLLSVIQLSEALLCLGKGPDLLAKMVANMPDSLHQVVTSLVLNGETLDEVSLAGRCRATAIKMLCCMHPPQSAYVQSLAVTNCKHPTLALWLALEAEEKKAQALKGQISPTGSTPDPIRPRQSGVVTLLHNIIIAGDDQKRVWFSQYLKCMQQKYRRHRLSAVTLLRVFLMKKLQSFFKKPITTDPLSSQSTPAPTLSHQTSEESMEEDGDNREEAHTHSSTKGDDANINLTDEEDGGILESEKTDTLEDLVDQMEIEISDHEDDKIDEATAEKEGKVTPEMGVTIEGESSNNTDSAQSTSKVPIEVKGHTTPMSDEQTKTGEVVQRRGQRRLSLFERIEFRPISLDCQLSDDDIIELMELLQVCCALKTQAQMYLKEEEAGAILSLITCSCPPFSPAGVSFVETTLCVLLACPFLISVDACEESVVSWFKWLLEKQPDFDRACGGHRSYGELLLLVAIHLREKQHNQIKDVIASTLHMKVSGTLKSGHFSAVRKLFLSVFSEDVVCAHAVSVPPTTGLSGLITGYLPIHCVNQLVKTRTFRKHGISIKDWIYQQVLTVSEPLHPILSPLLQEFVNSILLPSQRAATYGTASKTAVVEAIHKPFSAEEVLSVFQRDPDSSDSKSSIASQLLMFYYVLLYQDCYHTNLKALLMQSQSAPSSTPGGYSTAVLAKIPVKYLLNYAQQNQSSYSNLYPTLLKLTAIQFSHLCLVCEWLTEKKIITDIKFEPIARISKKMVNPESAQTILENLQTQPSQALLLLAHLSTLTSSSLTPYTHVILSTLTLLLDPCVPRRIQDLYVTLWTKLKVIIPRRLLLHTVNVLRPSEMKHMRPFTHQNIAEDPLIVLRCDTRVFRCPPLFDILLRIVCVYTTYSSSWLQERAYTQNCVALATTDVRASPVEGQAMKQQKEELCNALIAAQESALIQMLLEICLPSDKDKEEEACFGPQLTALQEIRCLFCSYLHHTFICQPSLVKLVHFQGYPTQLLPMMVSGVPSVHICLDFVSELLSQPQIEKQQFGVQLAAHVIHQYPLPEVMSIAEDIFKRLMILTNEIPDEIREQYFLPLLPSVVQLCQTFPPLCSEATKFLVHLSKACESSQISLLTTNTERAAGVSTASMKIGTGTRMARPCSLSTAIKETFQDLISSAVVKV